VRRWDFGLPSCALGGCTVDSVASCCLFEDSDATPLHTGYRYQYGAQLSGGTEAVRYFITGEREDETGPIKLPDFEYRRFDSLNIPLRDYVERPNVLGKNSVRANLNATVTPELDLAISTGFINLAQRFTQESNATAGLGSQAFGGPGCKVCAPARVVAGTGSDLNGYRAWTPGYVPGESAAARESLHRLGADELAADDVAAEPRDGRKRLHQSRR
jgi:hypothetical protein